MRNIFILSLTLLITLQAYSVEKSTAERMLVAMGIDKVLAAQQEATESIIESHTETLMAQLKDSLDQLGEETKDEVRKIVVEMMSQAANSWDVETAILVYSKEWSKNYTEEELLQIIEKYEQPEAKKELDTVMAASKALNDYIAAQSNVALQEALAHGLPKIQEAIRSSYTKPNSNQTGDDNSE